jgi:hypothetical protein
LAMRSIKTCATATLPGRMCRRQEVQKIWRNTTQFIALDSPVYEQFFVTVCAINQRLAPEKRLRILLADPPLDWSITPESKLKLEWGRAMFRRDSHFAGVVEKEVLTKGRKALLITGGAHLVRGVSTNNLTGHIERMRPHSMFIVTSQWFLFRAQWRTGIQVRFMVARNACSD